MTSSTLARMSESMMWPSTSTSSVGISGYSWSPVAGSRGLLPRLGRPVGRPAAPGAPVPRAGHLEPVPGRLLGGADRWGMVGLVDVLADHLDHPGGGDGQQRTEEAEQLDADQDADQH